MPEPRWRQCDIGDGGTYADVNFDPDADFEPVPASTHEERRALLARVEAHVAG